MPLAAAYQQTATAITAITTAAGVLHRSEM
jgi:hypothetical protein